MPGPTSTLPRMELMKTTTPLIRVHQWQQSFGQAHRSDGVGEEQLADFRLAGFGGRFVLRPGDAGVDEQDVDRGAGQACGQLIDAGRVVHVQGLDAQLRQPV